VKIERSPNFVGDVFLSANLKDLVKFYLKKNYKQIVGENVKMKFESFKKKITIGSSYKSGEDKGLNKTMDAPRHVPSILASSDYPREIFQQPLLMDIMERPEEYG
jgi:hypothetical protein